MNQATKNEIINITTSDVTNLEVINTINKTQPNSLKITLDHNDHPEELIGNLTSFLENINPNISVLDMPYLNEVQLNLKIRHTYQGFNKSILNYVRREISQTVTKDDYVIDATIGNGNDTLFLATIVTNGKVFGYDIQKAAIMATKEKVKAFPNVYLYQESHENMINLKLDKKIKIILFNLGYLPKGDKNITTKAHSTLKAIQNGLNILATNGKILVVIYPGHAEGKREKEVILNWLEKNNYPYEIKRNADNPIAPFLVIIKNN